MGKYICLQPCQNMVEFIGRVCKDGGSKDTWNHQIEIQYGLYFYWRAAVIFNGKNKKGFSCFMGSIVHILP